MKNSLQPALFVALLCLVLFSPNGLAQTATESLLGKKWTLSEVNGAAVKTTKAYLEFDPKAKRFSGEGGCNRIAGAFEIEGSKIRFAQAISTQRACLDNEVAKMETEFFEALRAVSRFDVDGGNLRLYRDDRAVLTFRSASTQTTDSSQTGRVTGAITYRQRTALPPDAVIEVKLVDVSRSDSPSMVIAEQTIRPEGRQVPISFDLQYDASRIDQRRRYAVEVRIVSGGRVRFTNSQVYPVITQRHATKVNVIVKQVSGK